MIRLAVDIIVLFEVVRITVGIVRNPYTMNRHD